MRRRDGREPAAVQTLPLTVRREARVTLAWCEYRLSKLRGESGDHEWEIYWATRQQVVAEQEAEGGRVPESIDGCIAVLDVAAEIIEALPGIVSIA